MLKRVEQYIEKEKLFSFENKILVGLSGGADSVVLLDILLRLNYECIAAHCNFHLRGKESMRDEEFVKKFSSSRGVPLICVDFNTVDYASSQKISIEMAARELRYDWFREMAAAHDADVIAVGHHADDSAETILLNLIRGTGLKGLTGIRPKNGDIVRPLLAITRTEIEAYCQQHGLSYVTDSTNLDSEYTRNKIRNIIIPSMRQINPSVTNTLYETGKRMRGIVRIYEKYMETAIEQVTHYKGNELHIDINRIIQKSDPNSILFEILISYGFSSEQIYQIAESLEAESGIRFISTTHQLIKDRNHLIVRETNPDIEEKAVVIDEDESEIIRPLHLSIRSFDKPANFSFSKEADCIHLDADKVKFPLTLRKWQKGDFFYPLGMQGKQKLSDFFINQKLTLFEKKETFVLLSDDQIVWVIGKRIDNRFKLEKTSVKILEIKFLENL